MTDESKTLVALLVTDGFEQSEYVKPKDALTEAGFLPHTITPDGKSARAWNHSGWDDSVQADKPLEQADPRLYAALVLPGGVMNPDSLRVDERVHPFVRHFFAENKPVAAICHGAWTLINTGVVKGRTMTSYPSVRRDLENAGAHWEDREVVVDGNLITSRRPDDLPAFNRELLKALKAEPAVARG